MAIGSKQVGHNVNRKMFMYIDAIEMRCRLQSIFSQCRGIIS
jgi:hypothetical protein